MSEFSKIKINIKRINFISICLWVLSTVIFVIVLLCFFLIKEGKQSTWYKKSFWIVIILLSAILWWLFALPSVFGRIFIYRNREIDNPQKVINLGLLDYGLFYFKMSSKINALLTNVE